MYSCKIVHFFFPDAKDLISQHKPKKEFTFTLFFSVSIYQLLRGRKNVKLKHFIPYTFPDSSDTDVVKQLLTMSSRWALSQFRGMSTLSGNKTPAVQLLCCFGFLTAAHLATEGCPHCPLADVERWPVVIYHGDVFVPAELHCPQCLHLHKTDSCVLFMSSWVLKW